MQIELTQNGDRYSYSSGVWKISAKSGLKPVEITEGNFDVELTPLLSVGGVIVHITDTDYYLGSKEMIENLSDSLKSNPHFSYKEHSKVLGAVMGRTIPILRVLLTPLQTSIESQKVKGKNAGVKEVVWSLDEEYMGLIEQINWTLSPTSPKPKDRYKIFDLNLSGDYSITSLPITPLDENKKIPEDVLASNLKIISDRIVELRKDFNSIKDLFYNGKSINQSSTSYNVLASSEGDELEVQVVTKESQMVSKSDTPATQQADVQTAAVQAVKSDVQTTTTTLQQRITNNEATIKAAQAGDAQAQKSLNDANSALRDQLKALQDRYMK